MSKSENGHYVNLREDEAATNWVLSTKNYRLHGELPRILDFIMNGVKTGPGS